MDWFNWEFICAWVDSYPTVIQWGVIILLLALASWVQRGVNDRERDEWRRK